MITDITGTTLIPGNRGKDCPGNGMTHDENGNLIECCCDECDFMLECFPEYDSMRQNAKGSGFLPEKGKKHL